MSLAGFRRNCLSKWYREAGQERGVEISDETAREIIYGMPYRDWKASIKRKRRPRSSNIKLVQRRGHQSAVAPHQGVRAPAG